MTKQMKLQRWFVYELDDGTLRSEPDEDGEWVKWEDVEEREAGGDLFADLIEHWERRCVTLDKLAADAEKTACDETITRLKTKAEVTRLMTAELKREISKANALTSGIEMPGSTMEPNNQ